MKTAKEAAYEHMQKVLANADLNINYEEDNHDAGVRDAIIDLAESIFHAGAQWAEGWISVSEELPENDTGFPFVKYIVAVDITAENYQSSTYTVATYEGNDEWRTDRTDQDIQSIVVTHWRPIERKTAR